LSQHVNIEPQILAGALKGMVAEQIADHFDAYTACEQPYGKRMPQGVSRISLKR
jgi:hypothetical protein